MMALFPLHAELLQLDKPDSNHCPTEVPKMISTTCSRVELNIGTTYSFVVPCDICLCLTSEMPWAVWQVTRLFQGHREECVMSVACSNAGRKIAAGSVSGAVRLFDAATLQETRVFQGMLPMVHSTSTAKALASRVFSDASQSCRCTQDQLPDKCRSTLH